LVAALPGEIAQAEMAMHCRNVYIFIGKIVKMGGNLFLKNIQLLLAKDVLRGRVRYFAKGIETILHSLDPM
jgi:hypothetical protein